MYLSVLLVLGRTILLHSCPLGSLVIQALYPISLLVSIPVGNLSLTAPYSIFLLMLASSITSSRVVKVGVDRVLYVRRLVAGEAINCNHCGASCTNILSCPKHVN